MQSILAIYDPEYSEHSLGIYTMGKEVQFAKSSGKDFYYMVILRQRFLDLIKLRLPEHQYYDAEQAEWRRSLARHFPALEQEAARCA